MLVQRRLRWLGRVARRPEEELIKDLHTAHTASHVAQTNWRPDEGVSNHDQSRPGAPLRTASLRLRTMVEGLVEARMSCRGCFNEEYCKIDR